MPGKPCVTKDYRIVNTILRDLRTMHKDLMPPGHSIAMKERPNSSALKRDLFAQKKYEINHMLRDIRASVRHCEILRRKEAKYKDYRSSETIQMITKNEEEILLAMEETKALSHLWQVEMKKKKKHVSEKVMEDRAMALQLIGRELDTLYKRNSRSEHKEQQTESALPPPDKNVQNAQAQFRKNTREHALNKRRTLVEGEAEWSRDLTENEIAFAARIELIHQEQNKLLYDVGSGLRELKDISNTMSSQLHYQKRLATDIGDEMHTVDDKLDMSNARLKNIMDKSGGAGLWCTRFVCFVFLCTLVSSFIMMIL